MNDGEEEAKLLKIMSDKVKTVKGPNSGDDRSPLSILLDEMYGRFVKV